MPPCNILNITATFSTQHNLAPTDCLSSMIDHLSHFSCDEGISANLPVQEENEYPYAL